MCPPDTILVIDDEADLADTCARVLESAGYRCLVANDVKDAISLFDSEHPDLVLSDITLPASNGFEIARHVRHKSPATPVVLMTAFHTAHVAREGQAAGAVAHLRKPFANKELIAVIKSLLLNHDGH